MKITFFPEEPSARVKYSMAWVNNLLNKTPRSPTQENPLRLLRVALPRERFRDVPVPEIDSPTREAKGPGRPGPP
ncbi:MAG: hypothetical protein LEGION0403_FIIPPAGN_02194 [Legionella sp.]